MYLIEALPTVIGTAAIAPALLMLWLVIAAEERPGPPAQVWTAFLLGAASISLLGIARAPFAKMVAAPDNPWAALAMHSIFGVAVPEEAAHLRQSDGHRGLWRCRRPRLCRL
jgi:cell shape-determining protein MreD